jgi:Leucine-rich repeat (LRR) protein
LALRAHQQLVCAQHPGILHPTGILLLFSTEPPLLPCSTSVAHFLGFLDLILDWIGFYSLGIGLDLRWCSQLAALPELLGSLNALQQLNLEGCSQLIVLPESLGNLSALRHLDAGKCSHLEALPESLGNQSALQQLNLRKCSHLVALPTSVGNLSALQQLESRSQLVALPESALGNLSALQQLDLR